MCCTVPLVATRIQSSSVLLSGQIPYSNANAALGRVLVVRHGLQYTVDMVAIEKLTQLLRNHALRFVFLLMLIPCATTMQLWGQSALLLPVGKEESNIIFSFQSGLEKNLAKEIVYWGSNSSGADEDDVLSRLDWNVGPLLTYSLGIQMRAEVGAFIALGLNAGIPLSDGTIEDRDWQIAGSPDVLTNFSRHDLQSNVSYGFDAEFGWRFQASSRTVLSPFLRFSYMHYKWSAVDGYVIYGSYTETPAEVTDDSVEYAVQGTGIIYQPSVYLFSLGFGGEFLLKEDLSMGVSIAVSPFPMVTAVDEHLFRSIEFTDIMNGGFSLQPRLGLAYKTKRKVLVEVSAEYMLISGLRGNEYIEFTSETEEGSPGVVYQALDVAGFSFNGFSVDFAVHVPLP